jgi:molecular chaperone DnaK
LPLSIGIDLGTTHTVVAGGGRLHTLPMADAHALLPSAVWIREDGQVVVGRAALNAAALYPDQVILASKRSMGDTDAVWRIHGRAWTPADVAAEILKAAKAGAERHLGLPVDRAVITVPAYFQAPQKEDTKRAGEMAGLRVMRLLPEPTAAAVSYGLGREIDQTILVYDLGGGTFDVAVLRVEREDFRVLSVDGDSRLGGEDFDRLLAGYLLDRHRSAKTSLASEIRQGLKHERMTGMDRAAGAALAKLLETARAAKIELTDSDVVEVLVPNILGSDLEIRLTLAEFEALVRPLIQRTMETVSRVLKAAGLDAEDLDRIVLAGGSTKMRLVRRLMTEWYREPWQAPHVDEVVAQGAAIVASSLDAPHPTVPAPKLIDVTAHDLGLRVKGGGMHVLVPRNTPLPVTVEYDGFTTSALNQKKVDVHVFQGPHARADENVFVGGFQLAGIPEGRAGTANIRVRFAMDQSDLLAVSATCDDRQRSQTLDVSMVSKYEETPPPKAVEIMLLVDTSGSMSSELEGVQESCSELARVVTEAGIDCRMGLIDFDLDSGDDAYTYETFGPMDPEDLPDAIGHLEIGRLGGCGCYVGDEGSVEVIEHLVGSFTDPSRISIGILFSDEVGNDAGSVRRIIHALKAGNVCLHVVGVPGSCHEKIAAESGGRFWDIQTSRRIDFESLLSTIAEEITDLALRT